MQVFLLEWFLYLSIYGFIGWAYESLLISIEERQPVNRGFLNGPICPVYGFGALACILFLYQKTDNVLVLFFGGTVLACAVEYITGYLLEKLFSARWWDYSRHRFNLHGRISLSGAVVFGIFAIVLIKWLHPFISALVHELSAEAVLGLTVSIFIVMTADLIVTVRYLLLLSGRLSEIQAHLNSYLEQYVRRAGVLKGPLGELKESLEEFKDSLEELRLKYSHNFEGFLEKFKESEYCTERLKKLFYLNKFQSIRIARAFPRLRLIKNNHAWLLLKSILLVKKEEETPTSDKKTASG